MGMQDATRQYIRQVWVGVVVRCLIDTAVATVVVVIVTAIAAVLVALGGGAVGLSFRHVRTAAVLVGCIYDVVILARTVWRHWVIAQVTVSQNVQDEREAVETDARHTAPSN